MAYSDQYTHYAGDSNFPHIVEIAMLTACLAVINESGMTPNHANRAAYATKVMNAPDTYANTFAINMVAFDDALDVSSSDYDLLTAANGVFDGLAGIS